MVTSLGCCSGNLTPRNIQIELSRPPRESLVRSTDGNQRHKLAGVGYYPKSGYRAANPCPQRQHERRDRCGLCHPRARAPRCALRRARLILHQPPIATLAARDRIAAAYANRDLVEVGGLMSYGTNPADRFRETGVYTGK